MKRIVFVTPTKDRPGDLRKMLASLAGQTRRPDQVIVDTSAEPAESVVLSVRGCGVEPWSTNRSKEKGQACEL